jgi:hypothetical protein
VADGEEIEVRHTLPRQARCPHIPHGQPGHQHNRAWSLADLRSFQRAVTGDINTDLPVIRAAAGAAATAVVANVRVENGDGARRRAPSMPGSFPSVNGSANRYL